MANFKTESPFDKRYYDYFNVKYKRYIYKLVRVNNHYGNEYGYLLMINGMNIVMIKYIILMKKKWSKFGFLHFYEMKNESEKYSKIKQILKDLVNIINLNCLKNNL